MNARDELAKTISAALGTVTGIYDTTDQEDREIADAILAAGYTKPRQVTTDTDLDSLPDGVLILTEQGGYWESIKRMDGKNWWKEPGKTDVSPSEDLTLPATVLYSPAAS